MRIVGIPTILAALLATAPAMAHDMYQRWQRPDVGGSCCSGDAVTGDCRRVRAYMHDDGQWRAQIGRGEWLIVPGIKVLPFNAPDGNGHLCEKGGRIYCFAPPLPKS
jgi:hypothetical protein